MILGGALVLAAAMDEGGFDAIEVTEAGLREGVFFERLLGEGQLFEDVRARVRAEPRASLRTPTSTHDLHVWKLSARCSTGWRPPGSTTWALPSASCSGPPAFCTTSAVAVNYDDHHRHSHYLILNAGLPGFGPRELVLIGLIARYHRKGEPDASELGDLAEPGDDDRLRLLCGVIRLAEQLERSRDRPITDVSVSANGGGVALEASTDPTRDATVPIWAARRNADLLAEALGRDVEISA